MGTKHIKKDLNDVLSKKITYKKILTINDSQRDALKSDTICAFKSIDNIYYLIYSTDTNSIISYNIIKKQIINEIKNAHLTAVIHFSHHLDKKNKRDLILSLPFPGITYEIKIWNVKNFDCLLILPKVNKKGCLFASCFLEDFNQIYIVTSKSGFHYELNPDRIKIFDLYGEKIKEINDSEKDQTVFIDIYYDKKLSKIYIITGNDSWITSYDYNINKKYRKYHDKDKITHNNIIIYDKEEIIKLIESATDGKIRIWNFHSGKMLYKINVCKEGLFGICLLNGNDLLVGSVNQIYWINLEFGIIIDKLIGHKDTILTIKKITDEKFGDILISHRNFKSIIFWVANN